MSVPSVARTVRVAFHEAELVRAGDPDELARPTPTALSKHCLRLPQILQRHLDLNPAKRATPEFRREAARAYLRSLDPRKTVFLAEDVERLEPRLVDLFTTMHNGDCQALVEVHELFLKRSRENHVLVRRLLSPFHRERRQMPELPTEPERRGYPRDAAEKEELLKRWVRSRMSQALAADRTYAQASEVVALESGAVMVRARVLDIDAAVTAFGESMRETIEAAPPEVPHAGEGGRGPSEETTPSEAAPLAGIGATIRRSSEGIVVDEVLPGSPAEQSGKLRPGDRILAVAEPGGIPVRVRWRDEQEISRLVLGPKGSFVRLRVHRPGWNAPEWIEVPRGTVYDESGRAAGARPRPSRPSAGPTRFVGELAVRGAHKVMATLYQDCGVLQAPPLSPELRLHGIHKAGRHRDGIGARRFVNNRHALLMSHPYLGGARQGLRAPASLGGETLACEAARDSVLQDPPIYDYGGKPHVVPGYPDLMDFFTNDGTGTSALGFDCSAFVFTALAAAGLKTHSEPGPIDARDVYRTAALAFAKASPSGYLDCFERVSFGSEAPVLQPGDLIAWSGHVMMVDGMGEDPFGLRNVSTVSQCQTGGISPRRFDFTIIQSSNDPAGDGVGVNRMRASDYFSLSSATARLRAIAAAACRARFGETAQAEFNGLAIVRHRGTPECRAEPVRLKHESCVAGCTPTGSDVVRQR